MADVLIIGAGAAGLAAAQTLTALGVSVTIVEARDRIGGRIFTRHERGIDIPIELGAEFVHGKPPDIFSIVAASGLGLNEVSGAQWCENGGRIEDCPDFFPALHSLLQKAEQEDRPDESFQALASRHWSAAEFAEVRERATQYVEGFNAAKAEEISVKWLIEAAKAEQSIDGEQIYRFARGYDQLIDSLHRAITKRRSQLQLGAAVRELHWRRGHVSAITDAGTFSAARAIVTLPLGVLQANTVRFAPALSVKQAAAQHLVMGPVIRVTLRFRQAFWRDLKTASGESLAAMSFLFSDDERFPTYWTMYPAEAPLIVAWASGQHADRLSHQPEAQLAEQAVAGLAKALGVQKSSIETELQAAYTHDWQADPFACGAYSYIKVGGLEAQKELARPVEDTLFFAGEATDTTGHSSTVHGAIASGRRAAEEVLSTIPRK